MLPPGIADERVGRTVAREHLRDARDLLADGGRCRPGAGHQGDLRRPARRLGATPSSRTRASRSSVTGREHLRPHETYLVMSNHQSLYDIPVLFYVIGPNIRMVTKKELFRVPVFGGALAAAGFISIDRSDRHRAIRSLDEARGLLASGTHVWIAPGGHAQPERQAPAFQEGRVLSGLRGGAPHLARHPARDARRAGGARECGRRPGRTCT